MLRYFLSLLLTINSVFLFSQEIYKITYEKYSNNIKVSDNNPITVFANNKETIIGTKNSFLNKRTFPNEITYFEKDTPNLLFSIIEFDSIKSLKTIDSTSYNQYNFKKLKDTKKILGLKAKKAQTIINSNTIDIWYVDYLDINAAPNSVGLNLGFVLEYTRNNNFTIKATNIEKEINTNFKSIYQEALNKEEVDLLTYKDLVWKNKFKTIPLLQNQQINYNPEENIKNDSLIKYANGTVVIRKIKLPEIKKGSLIFLDVEQYSNGDAYDRTGSVFLIPTKNKNNFLNGLKNGLKNLPIFENGNGKKYQGVILTNDFEPNIELMRFFTSFGINKYDYIQIKDKNWHNKSNYRQDISEYLHLLSNQEVYIGVFIGNYDKNGHILSANLTLHDSDKQIFNNSKSLSLFNTVNIMEMDGQEYPTMFNVTKGIYVEFELKENWNNAILRFVSTGHGGWANGDEFLPKLNELFLDDIAIAKITPWRTDCGSYRLFNPASGNFDNGLSSSDYSRSNWCPGTVTYPYFINLGNLKAGKHTFQLTIPQGEKEGSSFSSWLVSGVLLGD